MKTHFFFLYWNLFVSKNINIVHLNTHDKFKHEKQYLDIYILNLL